MFCYKIRYLIWYFLFCVKICYTSEQIEKTMAKFCANLAFLFTEKTFLDRYELAKIAGFKAVETGFPFGYTKQEVVNAKQSSGLEQVLINIYTGDVGKGELGFAAVLGKEKEFRESVIKTIDYAKALGTKKIHVMSGTVNENVSSEHDETYKTNLRVAAEMFEKEGIMGLIEPINPYSVKNYYMNSYDKAMSVLSDINSPNLKLMLDIFHLQQIKGNIVHSIQEMKDYIGHVQIAQVPHRHEPSVDGELNYKYIIDMLRNEGYTDWIGLEYKPSLNTTDSLKWIKDYGYTL